MVAQNAIVRDVRICQKVVVRAYDCKLVVFSGFVDGYVFAKAVVVADDYARIAAFELQILSLCPDEGVGIHSVIAAHLRVPVNRGVVVDDSSSAYTCLRADVGVCADFNIVGKLRAGFNDCSWMYSCFHDEKS